MKDATHLISLTVGVNNDGDWGKTWTFMNRLVENEFANAVPYVNLTSTHVGGEESDEDEYYDEYTMFKVFDAIKNSGPGFTEGMVREIIDNMQNAGILFRERGSRS